MQYLHLCVLNKVFRIAYITLLLCNLLLMAIHITNQTKLEEWMEEMTYVEEHLNCCTYIDG